MRSRLGSAYNAETADAQTDTLDLLPDAGPSVEQLQNWLDWNDDARQYAELLGIGPCPPSCSVPIGRIRVKAHRLDVGDALQGPPT